MSTPSSLLRALRPLLALAALAPLAASAQVIFIDFGQITTSGWNNVTSPDASVSAVTLIDFNTQEETSLTYQITADFSARSENSSSPAVDGYPESSVLDFFHGNSTSSTPKTSTIEFAGFDPEKSYTFTFLSSRYRTDSADLTTLFTVTGDSTNSVTTNANNNATTVSLAAIKSDENGVFVLDIAKGETNTFNYYYLNAIKIEASTIPEPSAAAMLVGGAALGLCVLRRRRR